MCESEGGAVLQMSQRDKQVADAMDSAVAEIFTNRGEPRVQSAYGQAAKAAEELLKAGVKAQVHPIEDITTMEIPQTDAPVVIADTGHLFCGATAEVAAQLAEGGNSRIKRVGPPFIPLPTSMPLEKEWYPSVANILEAANKYNVNKIVYSSSSCYNI